MEEDLLQGTIGLVVIITFVIYSVWKEYNDQK